MAEDFLGSLSKTLKKTVGNVSRKTDEFVEIQKIRSRQHSLEDQMEKNYQDIGQLIYQRYLGGEAYDESIADICADITSLEKEIAACKETVADRKGQNVCPVCGAGVPKEGAFCMHCGSPMPVKTEPEEAEVKPVEEPEEAAETSETADEVQEAAEETVGAGDAAAQEETSDSELV